MHWAWKLAVVALTAWWPAPGPVPPGDTNARRTSTDAGQLPVNSPLSASEQRRTFRLPSPLSIELVAAEPDVIDPVAVAWDESGRMYVVEMGDYPTGPAGGRIKLLEDGDGDGRFERVTVFADRLPFPTSVQPWRGGLIVTAAPDILYLKDTDADGVADVRTVLFTGFGEGNQQLRVNGLILGVDNWIYVANGRSDGSIRPVNIAALTGRPAPDGDTDADQPLSIRQRDFRFDPGHGAYEPVTGFTQHGHGFDDWGRRFIGWNTTHIRHVVLDRRYVERSVRGMGGVEEISDHGGAARIFPLSRTTQRFNIEPAGYINASCGLTIYRGDMLGLEYRGNAFVCEPLSNVVHRDILEASGATFIARRAAAERDREFLASADTWFRPVNLTTGPDGALYVVDFYRAFVEHPQFVRDERAREETDWRAGSDRGRIWRIVPQGVERVPRVRLDRLEPRELVAVLESANGWMRDAAQRLLVERRAADAAPALVTTATRSASPQARLHALRILHALGLLGDPLLQNAFADPHAAVRDHAIQMAESRLEASPALAAEVIRLADDPDARVRFQAVCTLGSVPASPEIITALGRVAQRDINDRWTRQALLTGTPDTAVDLIARLLDGQDIASAQELSFIAELAAILTAGTHERTHSAQAMARAGAAAGSDRLLAVWMGLVDGFRLNLTAADREAVWGLLADDAEAEDRVKSLAEESRRSAVDTERPDHVRSLAIRLLSHLSWSQSAGVVEDLLVQPNSPAVQVAAVRSLSGHPDSAMDLVYTHWPALSPVVRRAALDTILTTSGRASRLALKLFTGEIDPAEINPADSERLAALCPEADRVKLRAIFMRSDLADRQKAIDAYRSAAKPGGDAGRGAELFKKHCATCHAIQGQGHRVGPDLASVAGRPPDRLLVDILDPSREVGSESYNLVIATKDGRVVSGILAGETDRSITLRRAEGIEETVARDQIEQLRSTGKSIMPDGFERSLSPQDVTDLLEFLVQGDRAAVPDKD